MAMLTTANVHEVQKQKNHTLGIENVLLYHHPSSTMSNQMEYTRYELSPQQSQRRRIYTDFSDAGLETPA